jgi:hypothetical protein
LADGKGPVYSCITDKNGHYLFDNLPLGTYLVWEDAVPGWEPVTAPKFEVPVYQEGTCLQTRFKNRRDIFAPIVTPVPGRRGTGVPGGGSDYPRPTWILETPPPLEIPGVPEGPPWPDWGEADIFCTVDGDPWGGVNTALGCIPIDYYKFITWLLTYSFGIGGGVAFLLMVYGGFQVITAAGNVEKVKAGKQLILSSASGLVLIVFSILILRLIGIKLLQIPGIY